MNKQRIAPIEVNPDNFRAIGHHLVDRIADFLDSLPTRPVTTGESPSEIRETLDSAHLLPDLGTDPARLMDRATDLLFDHSLFNSHRASGATSLPPPRRLESWVIFWLRLSIKTLAHGSSHQWQARSKHRPFNGSRNCLTTQPLAVGYWSAAAIWRTSSASWLRVKPEQAGMCAPSVCMAAKHSSYASTAQRRHIPAFKKLPICLGSEPTMCAGFQREEI